MKINTSIDKMLKEAVLNKDASLLRAANGIEAAIECAASSKSSASPLDLIMSNVVKFAELLDEDGFHKEAETLDNFLKEVNSSLEGSDYDRDSKYNFKANNAETLYRSLENVPKLEPTSPMLKTLRDSGVPALLTRHSPDNPGVNLLRIRDGVYQDRLTRKVYDFNSGFVDEFGREHQGGSVSHQTPSPDSFLPAQQVLEDKSRNRG